jgi:hypothetical protein
MRAYCLFENSTPPGRRVRIGASAAVLWLCACSPQSASVPQSVPARPPPPAAEATPLADFNSFLSKGDYAGAIKFVEQSALSDVEKDGTNGNLILDGWVDPNAVSRPPYPLTVGFVTLERAAAAGRSQSVADLRAKFTTGINYEGKKVLMAPNQPLAECWTKVESVQEAPSTCITLRRRLQVP